MMNFLLFVLVTFVVTAVPLIAISPTRAKKKRKELLLRALRPGHQIVTQDGILGTVVERVAGGFTIEVEDSQRLYVPAQAISDLRGRRPPVLPAPELSPVPDESRLRDLEQLATAGIPSFRRRILTYIGVVLLLNIAFVHLPSVIAFLTLRNSDGSDEALKAQIVNAMLWPTYFVNFIVYAWIARRERQRSLTVLGATALSIFAGYCGLYLGLTPYKLELWIYDLALLTLALPVAGALFGAALRWYAGRGSRHRNATGALRVPDIWAARVLLYAQLLQWFLLISLFICCTLFSNPPGQKQSSGPFDTMLIMQRTAIMVGCVVAFTRFVKYMVDWNCTILIFRRFGTDKAQATRDLVAPLVGSFGKIITANDSSYDSAVDAIADLFHVQEGPSRLTRLFLGGGMDALWLSDDWQSEVLALLSGADVVIADMDSTSESIFWELRASLLRLAPARIIIVTKNQPNLNEWPADLMLLAENAIVHGGRASSLRRGLLKRMSAIERTPS